MHEAHSVRALRVLKMSDLSQVVAVLCGSCTAPPSNFLSLNCLASEEELTSVCSALKTSNFTGGLRLGVSCNVGDRGAAALAAALTVNQALESLELPGRPQLLL